MKQRDYSAPPVKRVNGKRREGIAEECRLETMVWRVAWPVVGHTGSNNCGVSRALA